MNLRLEHANWLYLILLLVPLAIVAVRMFRTMAVGRLWLAILLRGLVLTCAALLLAGATIVRTSNKLAVVAVVDVSGSVRELAPRAGVKDVDRRIREFLAAASAGRGNEDLFSIVLFDGAVVPLGVPLPPPRLTTATGLQSTPAAPTDSDVEGMVQAMLPAGDPLSKPWDSVQPLATDLAAAVQAAAMLIPADASGRIIVFSDGVATRGDTLAAAAMLGTKQSSIGGSLGTTADSIRRGVPVDVVPIRYTLGTQIVLESLDAPSSAPAGSVVPVRVVIESTVPVSGRITLTIEGVAVDLAPDQPGHSAPVTLVAGRNVVVLSAPLPRGRVHRMEARLEPDGPAMNGPNGPPPSNLIAEAVTVTPGAGSILLVHGNTGGDVADAGSRTLEGVLRTELGEVQTINAAALPTDLVDLQRYDLVIFENVGADLVSPIQQRILVEFVNKLGGGFVMVGGSESFGPGGWRGSQLEPILPVLMQLPERLVMPAVAVTIVMDSSGSMGFRVGGSTRSQQDIANEGAAMAVRTLDKDDLLGVIEFNSRAKVVMDLAPNSDPAEAVRRIRGISPGGGTNMPPALEAAHQQLKSARANIKHCIILTDGVSSGRDRLESTVRAMAADGIKVSTICVGDEADTETLENMAIIGGGTYYRVENPMSLPRVFLKAMRVVRQPQIRETPFVPVISPATMGATMGLADLPGGVPPLGGLVITTPRQVDATRISSAVADRKAEGTADLLTGGVSYPMLAPSGEPVLAVWQVGLGQVAAFTSDASKWAKLWVSWPGYRQFWSQLARQIGRDSTGRAGELTTSLDGDRLIVRYEASDQDNRPIDGLLVPVTIFRPDNSKQELQLVQTAPGIYEAVAPMRQTGTAVVVASPRQPGAAPSGGLAPRVTGVVRPQGQELRATTSNERTLEQLALLTGGRTFDLDKPPTQASQTGPLWLRAGITPRQTRLPLWPYLAPLLAALVYLDIANRRVAWDRVLSKQFGLELLSEARAGTASRGQQAASALAGLNPRGKREATAAARATADSVTSLGGDEAKRLVAEARARRVAFRPAVKSPEPAEFSGSSSIPTSGGQPERNAEQEGGLLAAKRRARDRMQ